MKNVSEHFEKTHPFLSVCSFCVRFKQLVLFLSHFCVHAQQSYIDTELSVLASQTSCLLLNSPPSRGQEAYADWQHGSSLSISAFKKPGCGKFLTFKQKRSCRVKEVAVQEAKLRCSLGLVTLTLPQVRDFPCPSSDSSSFTMHNVFTLVSLENLSKLEFLVLGCSKDLCVCACGCRCASFVFFVWDNSGKQVLKDVFFFTLK